MIIRNESKITQAVKDEIARAPNQRFREIMSTAVRHRGVRRSACTAMISPHSMRRLCTSWIMLRRIGPPPASRRQGPSTKY
jgi:hypothetical protein